MPKTPRERDDSDKAVVKINLSKNGLDRGLQQDAIMVCWTVVLNRLQRRSVAAQRGSVSIRKGTDAAGRQTNSASSAWKSVSDWVTPGDLADAWRVLVSRHRELRLVKCDTAEFTRIG